jgi:hypothetical protein
MRAKTVPRGLEIPGIPRRERYDEGMRQLGWTIVASALALACGSRESSSEEEPGDGAATPPDAPCATGPGTTVLSPGFARGVVVDDGFAYTVTNEGIIRVPRAGGAIGRVLETKDANALTADDASLYFFGSTPTGPALFALPRSGGTARVVGDRESGTTLLADGNALYWVHSAELEQLDLRSGSRKEFRLGTSNIPIVEAMASARDAVILAVYTVPGLGQAGAGSILRASKTSGEVTTVIDGLGRPTSLALDENRIYFTDPSLYDGGAVLSVRLDGSELTVIARAWANSVAVDAHAVYYATESAIMKVDKASGASSELATDLVTPGDLVVRGGNVYWANGTRVAFSAKDPPRALVTACK